jgi:hypothetical protein
MQRFIAFLGTLRRFGQKLGPYLMVEILLPGGSLIALMLFLYQRRKAGVARTAPQAAPARMRPWASLVPQGILVPQPSLSASVAGLRSAVVPRE